MELLDRLGLVDIQAEKRETIEWPDNSITDVHAKRTHKAMEKSGDEDMVTDTVPGDVFILSEYLRINKKDAEEVVVGETRHKYSEKKKGKEPEVHLASDVIFRGKERRISPAKASKNVRRAFNIVEDECDPLAIATNLENLKNREPYLNTIKALSEVERGRIEALENAGKVEYTPLMKLGGPIPIYDPSAEMFQNGGGLRGLWRRMTTSAVTNPEASGFLARRGYDRFGQFAGDAGRNHLDRLGGLLTGQSFIPDENYVNPILAQRGRGLTQLGNIKGSLIPSVLNVAFPGVGSLVGGARSSIGNLIANRQQSNQQAGATPAGAGNLQSLLANQPGANLFGNNFGGINLTSRKKGGKVEYTPLMKLGGPIPIYDINAEHYQRGGGLWNRIKNGVRDFGLHRLDSASNKILGADIIQDGAYTNPLFARSSNLFGGLNNQLGGIGRSILNKQIPGLGTVLGGLGTGLQAAAGPNGFFNQQPSLPAGGQSNLDSILSNFQGANLFGNNFGGINLTSRKKGGKVVKENVDKAQIGFNPGALADIAETAGGLQQLFGSGILSNFIGSDAAGLLQGIQGQTPDILNLIQGAGLGQTTQGAGLGQTTPATQLTNPDIPGFLDSNFFANAAQGLGLGANGLNIGNAIANIGRTRNAFDANENRIGANISANQSLLNQLGVDSSALIDQRQGFVNNFLNQGQGNINTLGNTLANNLNQQSNLNNAFTADRLGRIDGLNDTLLGNQQNATAAGFLGALAPALQSTEVAVEDFSGRIGANSDNIRRTQADAFARNNALQNLSTGNPVTDALFRADQLRQGGIQPQLTGLIDQQGGLLDGQTNAFRSSDAQSAALRGNAASSVLSGVSGVAQNDALAQSNIAQNTFGLTDSALANQFATRQGILDNRGNLAQNLFGLNQDLLGQGLNLNSGILDQRQGLFNTLQQGNTSLNNTALQLTNANELDRLAAVNNAIVGAAAAGQTGADYISLFNNPIYLQQQLGIGG